MTDCNGQLHNPIHFGQRDTCTAPPPSRWVNDSSDCDGRDSAGPPPPPQDNDEVTAATTRCDMCGTTPAPRLTFQSNDRLCQQCYDTPEPR